MTRAILAHQGARCLAEAMATERKIGRHTYRRLTDGEAPADPILEQLHKLGMEVTRRNYLLLMYGGEPTEPLDAEAEALLPAFLRRQP
jgi:hypothetical protein